jgi:deoxyribodipyrimidine photo-lyase
MYCAVILFTRDLRVHDNPALAAACASARQVAPLFVADPGLSVPANRARFLAQSVAALAGQLRQRGGDLLIRRGDPVAEVMRLARQTGAEAVFVADDVSRYAARRQRGLEAECARHRLRLTVTPGHAATTPMRWTRRGPAGPGYPSLTPG